MRITRSIHLRAPAGALVAAAALAGAGVAALPAHAASSRGSIVYVKSGKLWVAGPDGKAKRRVPHRGRFDNPSQADNGTIVAQRGTALHRMNRRGRALNRPITTAFRTHPALPAFKGPLWPEVSPDGKKIAYTYSFTASRFDPGCQCFINGPSLNTAYTDASRFVENPVAKYGKAGFYMRASWIDNRQVLATSLELYDFAGNVLDQVATDRLGGGDDSFERWFSQCDPCDSIETLKKHPLDEGEMTRQKTRLVFTAGELGGAEPGTRLAVYQMNGNAPAMPGDPCWIEGPNGRFTSPTWSPDGRALAWADRRGIWVGRVTSIPPKGSCGIEGRRLIIPGGRQPDWGPARP